jgi:hypothetical protein
VTILRNALKFILNQGQKPEKSVFQVMAGKSGYLKVMIRKNELIFLSLLFENSKFLISKDKLPTTSVING